MKTLIALFLTLMISTESFADAQADALLKGAASSGGIAAGEEISKEYLNAHAAQLPGLEHLGSKAGTYVIGAVGVILGGKEFFDAKNDKGRLFGALDTGIAITAMINPVIGGIAMIGMLAIKLVDGILSAGAQRELLEIYARIAEHLKRIAELRTMAAKAELEIVRAAQERSDSADRVLAADAYFHEYFCKEAGAIDNLFILDTCIGNLNQIFDLIQVKIGQAEVLENFQSEYFDANKVFENMGLSRENLKAQTASLKERLRKTQIQFADTRQKFHTAALDLVKNKANTLTVSQRQRMRDSCFDRASDLIEISLAIRAPEKLRSQLEQLQVDKVTKPVIYDDMESFNSSLCVTLDPSKNDQRYNKVIEIFKNEFSQLKKEMNL